jgi:hypothetical protein
LKHFLVVDQYEKENDHRYRHMLFTGCTYSEADFRVWVSETWNVSKDLPIPELSKVASKGGWVVYENHGA